MLQIDVETMWFWPEQWWWTSVSYYVHKCYFVFFLFAPFLYYSVNFVSKLLPKVEDLTFSCNILNIKHKFDFVHWKETAKGSFKTIELSQELR